MGAVTLSLQKSAQQRFVKGHGYSKLQWGCNFIVTEILQLMKRIMLNNTLQWGCNFIVTEISLPYQHQTPHYPASMGL